MINKIVNWLTTHSVQIINLCCFLTLINVLACAIVASYPTWPVIGIVMYNGICLYIAYIVEKLYKLDR